MANNKRKTKKFDNNFRQLEHYQRHPQMMPFVGKNYKNGLLIIGESHYLDERTPKGIIKKWYDNSLEELQKDLDNYKTVNTIKDELKEVLSSWTDTSGLIDETDYSSNGHTIFGNIDKAIQEITKIKQFECWSKIAFMNFFQRPAYKEGDSIIPIEKDVEIANETLDFVVNVIKPKYIYSQFKSMENIISRVI